MSEDRNVWRFGIRPEARFHDGTPVTAHDLAYSYLVLKEEGHPQISTPLREMTKAIALQDDVFELTFSGDQSAQTVLTAVTHAGAVEGLLRGP